MTRYRIVPDGLTQWRLQGRWLLWWRDIGRYTGYEYWEPYRFSSLTEARECLEGWQHADEQNRAAKRRGRFVAPIEL